MENLIENSGKNPIEKLMIYRNDNTTDVDRRAETMKTYKKLGMLTNNETQEPDTFVASAYDTLRKLANKVDSQFYVDDFKRYVEEYLNEDYVTLNKNQAKRKRVTWFRQDSTYNHYPFMNEPVVQAYVHATHTLGNFCIVGKGHGGIKCLTFNENPVAYLKWLEENWDENKQKFQNITFGEYKDRMLLNGFYNADILREDEYSLDFDKSLIEIYRTMGNIVKLIEERDSLLNTKLLLNKEERK